LSAREDDHTEVFPGFSTEAVTFLARAREVSGIGVDTLSLDPGVDTTYAAHKAWLATGKWGVELVANLEHVPPVGATVFVGAAKVRGAFTRSRSRVRMCQALPPGRL
jgi:kynurenine formamidase